MSSSPAITRGATTVPAACDGEAKRTASAARTSKAPVAATTHRGVLFDGVSRPNRCGTGGLYRWTVGPTHEIVQTINASSGGAIHTVIPIQKRKSFRVSAIASANTRWVVVFTTVLTTRRGAPAPRRVATREASKLHPADGVDRASATCRVPPRRFFDFQRRGTPRARS